MSYNQSAPNQTSYNVASDTEQYAAIYREVQLYQDATYNQLPMNAPYDEIVVSEGCFGVGTGTARINGIYAGKLKAAGIAVAGMRLSVTRFCELLAEAEATVTLAAGKIIITEALAYGVGGVDISNESFNIFIMGYDGTLAPGERITINTERFTLKKDGVDALELLNGNFVDLKTGINEVVIESDTGTRTLVVRVEHRDRWV